MGWVAASNLHALKKCVSGFIVHIVSYLASSIVPHVTSLFFFFFSLNGKQEGCKFAGDWDGHALCNSLTDSLQSCGSLQAVAAGQDGQGFASESSTASLHTVLRQLGREYKVSSPSLIQENCRESICGELARLQHLGQRFSFYTRLIQGICSVGGETLQDWGGGSSC